MRACMCVCVTMCPDVENDTVCKPININARNGFDIIFKLGFGARSVYGALCVCVCGLTTPFPSISTNLPKQWTGGKRGSVGSNLGGAWCMNMLRRMLFQNSSRTIYTQIVCLA